MHPIDIIIETPRGHSEKFNYDQQAGRFRLKKLLPTGMVFPYDFGYIPNTIGQDGDPLDALVISEINSFPGCILECRLLGALICEQKSKGNSIRNDRFLFVPVQSKQFASVKTVKNINPDIIRELSSFFKQYNLLEGKEFNILKHVNDRMAYALIRKSYA